MSGIDGIRYKCTKGEDGQCACGMRVDFLQLFLPPHVAPQKYAQCHYPHGLVKHSWDGGRKIVHINHGPLCIDGWVRRVRGDERFMYGDGACRMSENLMIIVCTPICRKYLFSASSPSQTLRTRLILQIRSLFASILETLPHNMYNNSGSVGIQKIQLALPFSPGVTNDHAGCSMCGALWPYSWL